jgi:hypothetical protein
VPHEGHGGHRRGLGEIVCACESVLARSGPNRLFIAIADDPPVGRRLSTPSERGSTGAGI